MTKESKVKKEYTKKSAKGITLIALVVTIVILIILAGVAINLSLSNNGIFNKAKQAREDYKHATNEEQSGITNIEKTMEEIAGGVAGGTTAPKVIEGPVAGGSYDNPYIPTGFTHTEGEGTWNSGYVIKETSTGNVFVWVPCVLDQSKVKAGDTVQTFQKTTTGKYNENSYTLSPTDTSVTDVEPTNAIKTSVGTYGGFYIAAYEAGIEGETDNNGLETKTATDGSVKPLSKAGYRVWNSITRADALTVAASMVNTTDGVKSGLISGECWDTTLQWMVNSSTKASSNVGYDINSTGKGWYNDVASKTRHTTGFYEINNIYDMAGNLWEWTTERCSIKGYICLVIRGGGYNNSGITPAAYRYGNDDYEGDIVAFRVVLYK